MDAASLDLVSAPLAADAAWDAAAEAPCEEPCEEPCVEAEAVPTLLECCDAAAEEPARPEDARVKLLTEAAAWLAPCVAQPEEAVSVLLADALLCDA